MPVFNLLLFSLIGVYGFIIVWLVYGNLKSSNKSNKNLHSVSIIIAIRNGGETLPALIYDLSHQNYSGSFEVILVDDNSTDDTQGIIKKAIKNNTNFKYQSSQNGDSSLSFKKRALDAGIKISQNEWLLFTDADCRLSKTWLEGMVSYFHPETDYVLGYSKIEKNNGILNMFESIDFLLLLTSALGAANNSLPLACTGQNQAYRKSLFNKVNGFNYIHNCIQGDDSLFMNICKRIGKANVVFANNKKCHVSVKGEKSWLALFKQRLRWAGDVEMMRKVNLSFYLILLGFLFLHIKLLILIIIAIFLDGYYMLLIKCMLIKYILELLLYYTGCKYLNNTISLFKFSIWYFIHIPYICLIGLSSFFYKNSDWRGREFIA